MLQDGEPDAEIVNSDLHQYVPEDTDDEYMGNSESCYLLCMKAVTLLAMLILQMHSFS